MRVGLRARLATATVLVCAIAAGLPGGAAAAGKRVTLQQQCATELIKQLLASHTPTPLSQPLDPVITGIYAVLRRPTGAQDSLPAINPLGEDLGQELRAYFPEDIRQLAVDSSGERYFLVAGYARVFPVPPARCLPKPIRRLRARLVEQQRKRETVPTYCVADVGPRQSEAGGYATCQPFASVQTGERLDAELTSRHETVDLVPDGVATVRIAYRNGTTFNVPVSENAFVFSAPPQIVARLDKELRRILAGVLRAEKKHPSAARRRAEARRTLAQLRRLLLAATPTVQWLDPAGNVIRTFPPELSGQESIVGVLLGGAAGS